MKPTITLEATNPAPPNYAYLAKSIEAVGRLRLFENGGKSIDEKKEKKP